MSSGFVAVVVVPRVAGGAVLGVCLLSYLPVAAGGRGATLGVVVFVRAGAGPSRCLAAVA